MGIWQLDTPSIEYGVHSALLATERVKLLDGWRHGHPELHLDYAFMGRETEDRASHVLVGRVSSILVGRFSKDRWLITPCSVQRYSVSMDSWKACERRDHERRANFGGEIRSGCVVRC